MDLGHPHSGNKDNSHGHEADRDLERHLPALLREAEISAVQLDVLTRPPSFRGTEVSEEAQAITGPARNEHQTRHFGFWEFALASAVDASQQTRVGLLQGALRHNSGATIQTVLTLDQFARELEAGSFRGLPARHIVSLTSRVDTQTRDSSDGPWHLPMLDMGLPADDQGLVATLDALTVLGARGALFSSGRSYHFVGKQPVSHSELLKLLARAQLLSPIVDTRWVSHQLLDGQCGLRISTDVEKHQRVHQLVATI